MFEFIRRKQMIYFLLTGAKKKISTGPCKIIYEYLCIKKFLPINYYISPVVKRIIHGKQSKEITDINMQNKMFNFKKVNHGQYFGPHLIYNPCLYRFEMHTNFSVSKKLNIIVYEFINFCNGHFIEKYSPGSLIPDFPLEIQNYIVKNWY
jgi:hypothetical protein